MTNMVGDERTWQGIADTLGDLRRRHVQRAREQLEEGRPEVEVVGACVVGALNFNDRHNLAVMYAAGVVADAKGAKAVVVT